MYPKSTSTAIVDIRAIRPGQSFVWEGLPYMCLAGPRVSREHGVETITVRTSHGIDVVVRRPYAGTLDEIL